MASTIGLGYGVDQSSFDRIALYFGVGFLAYAYLLSNKKWLEHWPVLVGVGLLCRFLLLFGMPNLSDDIYRFIWDGRLILNGVNPFTALPASFLEANPPLDGIDQALFDQLNSPDYFTIYPPLAQGSFALSVSLFFDHIL